VNEPLLRSAGGSAELGLGHAHPHPHRGDSTRDASTRLALSLGITLAFVLVEAIAGVKARSLALLSDAGHNLTDAVALGLSWYAVRLSTQPAHAGKTFGYHRAGILVALVNSTTLVVISLWIFYEAVHRFRSTPEVQSGVLIGVGALAFVINLLTAWLVKKGSEHDLNLRSAFVHLAGDAISTLGAVVAGVIIMFTGMNWLDPAVSVLIGGLILWNAWGILKETVSILLESTPQDIDLNDMVSDLRAVEGVRGVHDLHVWSITRSVRILSAHIVTDDVAISRGAALQRAVKEIVRCKYGVGHATLQLECVGCEGDELFCDIAENNKEKGDETR
jgi:cobalt-zinc-cadmium efflux system protein